MTRHLSKLWPSWLHPRRRDNHPRALHIRSGRRPHQRYIYAFAFAQGLVGMVSGATTGGMRSLALEKQMPGPFLACWFIAQVVMSGLVLIATLPKERPVDLVDRRERAELRGSLQCEGIGLAGMVFTSLGFGTSVLLYAGPSGTQIALTFVGFVFASGTRVIEIFVDLRKLHRAEAHPVLLTSSTVADPGWRG